ncbi:hypothetical protein [Parafilimonas sp.]|uniref:hypothetical protein n=1 Tax=Parafilimonas sp. TaxID=1969739 RepID=UPI0039E3CE2F
MSTKTCTIASDENKQLCINIIKQAVPLIHKNPYAQHPLESGILASHLFEGFHNLLLTDSPYMQDWGAKMLEYEDLLQSILILLGKPNIVNLLPDHHQENASLMIGDLINFFKGVDTDDTVSLLDLERLDYLPTDKEVQRSIEIYTNKISKCLSH